jgi:hypothetical protein
MRWTLKLELTTDDDKTQASEVGSILRSSSDLQPEEVGPTLEEGRLLLRDIECRLIADVVHAYTISWRRCPPSVSLIGGNLPLNCVIDEIGRKISQSRCEFHECLSRFQ